MELESPLSRLAEQVAEQLAEHRLTVVLAESCTGGLIAASLAAVPGISAFLAGSAVVYQSATKMRWLGVAEETLALHGAVSAPVAYQMVSGALQTTPHADLAAAVTGHLGPDAPPDQDGLIFVAVMRRSLPPKVQAIELVAKDRRRRQREAARVVLECLSAELGQGRSGDSAKARNRDSRKKS